MGGSGLWTTGLGGVKLNFNANRANSIYGNVTSVVRPPSVTVTFWRRTA